MTRTLIVRAPEEMRGRGTRRLFEKIMGQISKI
jgi:hypothetical protein